jgi:putative peptidoglycan lipid II flippase
MSRARRILDDSKKAFGRASNSIGFIALGMGFLIFLTKITSLFKLQLITSIYGIKSVPLDLFNAANIIPEFIFTIVVIGGINAALIPVFNQTKLNESEKTQKEVFSSIVNLFFIVLTIICTIVFIFAPQIVHLVSQFQLGNIENNLTAEDFSLFSEMLRILIISPIILCVSSIFSSILQVKKSFWITTLAPLFYNLGIIGSVIILTQFNNDIRILAYGVVFASLLHFIIQIPAIIRAKIQYNLLSLNTKDPYVQKAVRNTLPRIIGLASDYIGNIFQALVALSLQTGTLNSFRLATSLRDLPSSIFGLAIAQSAFPQMSEYGAKGDIESLQKLFSKLIRQILFWTIPITAVFIVLRTPIIQLVFGVFNKNIKFEDTNMVSYSLLFLSLGIIFYSILAVVNRAFYSLNDSKTPTIVSIGVIFIEISITYALANVFSHFDESLSVNPLFIFSNIDNYFINGKSPAAIGGLALASSIAIFLNLTILIFALRGKGINFFYEKSLIFKKLVSGAFSMVIGFLSFNFFLTVFETEKVVGVFFFTVTVTVVMSLSYYLAEKYLKDEDVASFDTFLGKLGRYAKRLRSAFGRSEIVGVPEV